MQIIYENNLDFIKYILPEIKSNKYILNRTKLLYFLNLDKKNLRTMSSLFFSVLLPIKIHSKNHQANQDDK